MPTMHECERRDCMTLSCVRPSPYACMVHAFQGESQVAGTP